MRKPDIAFDYMDKDNVVGRVEVYGNKVVYRSYTHEIDNMVFMNTPQPTIEHVRLFLEDRIFPESRDGVKDLLRNMNLETYDPLSICELTRGVTFDDTNWIRFDGDTKTWKDINPRRLLIREN